MSFRGRVIRRQPVAVYNRPQSIQEQTRQYRFLAELLRVPQFEVRSFAAWADAVEWLKTQGKLVTIKSVYADWNGPEDAMALVLPVGKKLSLNLYSANVLGSTILQNERSGFVYQKADGSWSNSTDLWQKSGPVESAAAGILTVVADPTAIVGSYVVTNLIADGEYGWWDQAGGIVNACYYVHPFFSRVAAVGGYSQTGSYIEEKVY